MRHRKVVLFAILLAGFGFVGVVGECVSRSTIHSRAMSWVDEMMPYSQSETAAGPDGGQYRTDCSGYVCMSWALDAPNGCGLGCPNTDSLISEGVAVPVQKDQLQMGDILDCTIARSPCAGEGHTLLFMAWTDDSQTSYTGCAEHEPGRPTSCQTVPYPYFDSDSCLPPDCFLPYRYRDICDCPNDCSGHGVCSSSSGECTCDACYQGNDCSQRNSCSGHGTCSSSSGRCVCDSCHQGDTCAQLVPPQCSSHDCGVDACGNQCGQCYAAAYSCSSCDRCTSVFKRLAVTPASSAFAPSFIPSGVSQPGGSNVYYPCHECPTGSEGLALTWNSAVNDTAWMPATTLPGKHLAELVVAVLDSDGSTSLWYIYKGQVYFNAENCTATSSCTWLGAVAHPTPSAGSADSLAVTLSGSGTLHVFATASGHLYACRGTQAAGPFSAWASLSVSGPVLDVSASELPDGSLMLFYALRDTANLRYQILNISTATWSGELNLCAEPQCLGLAPYLTQPSGSAKLSPASDGFQPTLAAFWISTYSSYKNQLHWAYWSPGTSEWVFASGLTDAVPPGSGSNQRAVGEYDTQGRLHIFFTVDDLLYRTFQVDPSQPAWLAEPVSLDLHLAGLVAMRDRHGFVAAYGIHQDPADDRRVLVLRQQQRGSLHFDGPLALPGSSAW